MSAKNQQKCNLVPLKRSPHKWHPSNTNIVNSSKKMRLWKTYIHKQSEEVRLSVGLSSKLLTYTSHSLANGIKVRMTSNEDYHTITNVDELISITPKYLQSFINMDVRNITACMYAYFGT